MALGRLLAEVRQGGKAEHEKQRLRRGRRGCGRIEGAARRAERRWVQAKPSARCDVVQLQYHVHLV